MNGGLLIALGIVAAFIGLVGSLRTVNKQGGRMTNETLDALYKKHANLKRVDPLLLKALATVESGERPEAINPTDPSYGLMQVLCVRKDGDLNGPCENRFPAVPGWSSATRNKLLQDVDFNVHVGSTIIAWNIGRYGFKKGIAVYNSWGARNDPDNGPFRNQSYVDKVLREYVTLGGSIS